MSYKIEEITPAAVEKIFADADEDKRSRMRARGGYFSDNPELKWAIDRERGFYLFRAPSAEPRSEYAHFYFHFLSITYGFRIKKFSRQETAKLDDLPPSSILDEFKRELKIAFSILQSEDHVPLYFLNLNDEKEVRS